MIIGLLSQNWWIFILLLILQISVTRLHKLLNFSFFDKAIVFSFIFGKFLLYLYLVINHFHLHNDNLLLIKNFIG
jgi:hypothetical protein